jgi:hypothetical protein
VERNKGYRWYLEEGHFMGADFAEAVHYNLEGKDEHNRITYQLTK